MQLKFQLHWLLMCSLSLSKNSFVLQNLVTKLEHGSLIAFINWSMVDTWFGDYVKTRIEIGFRLLAYFFNSGLTTSRIDQQNFKIYMNTPFVLTKPVVNQQNFHFFWNQIIPNLTKLSQIWSNILNHWIGKAKLVELIAFIQSILIYINLIDFDQI